LGEKDFYDLDVDRAKIELIKIVIELKKFNFQKKDKEFRKRNYSR
jgi:hypothetical protein